MSLKERLAKISQKRMNIKKAPTKNWRSVSFSYPDSANSILQKLKFKNEKSQVVNLNLLNESILKLYFSNNITKNDFYENFSWTINENVSKSIYGEWVQDSGNIIKLKELYNDKNVSISFNPLQSVLSLFIAKKKIFQSTISSNTKKNWICMDFAFDHDQFKCFGLGEHTSPLDQKGKKFYFWNSDIPGYKIGTNPLYQSWPFCIIYTDNLFLGIVFDNPSFSLFNLEKENIIEYFVKESEFNFYLLLGPSLKNILEQLHYLTGPSIPIPKFSLGYQQCRWSYTPSDKVREIANTFRDKEIPCDVIYLDIDYMEAYKCFTFGKDFSDYKELIKELHEKGFKIVPIIDPGIKIESDYFVYEEGLKQDYFIKDKLNNLVTIKVWPGECHYPDFINPIVVNWWSNLVENFVKESQIDGIWCDMNEPSTFDARRTLNPNVQQILHQKNQFVNHEKVHNIFGFQMSKATYEGLLRINKTPFVLTRSSYLGGQKFAVTWTGDNVASWDDLQTSIPMILSFGLSGQPVVGPDIGGFKSAPSDKLYDRWISQGAFYPFSRTHTALNTPDQEPWSFGKEVEEKAKKVLNLRYKFIPYYYSLLYVAHTKGYPILRPLFFTNVNSGTLDPVYYESEVFIGDYLLLTPFMTKSSKRQIYLPPGYWYSWWTKDEIHEGDKYLTIEDKDYEDVPLFFRNEAIIPMYQNNLQFIPDESQEDLSLLLVIKDSTQKNTFDFIEYFDATSVLGLKITLAKEETIIVLTMEEIRKGSIPNNKFLPKRLYLQINYFVRTIKDLDKNTYEINTDKDDWSEIVLNDPVYPLNLFIETLF